MAIRRCVRDGEMKGELSEQRSRERRGEQRWSGGKKKSSTLLACLTLFADVAAAAGHVEVVQVLLDHGANINERNAQQEVPLHRACLRYEMSSECRETSVAEIRRIERPERR